MNPKVLISANVIIHSPQSLAQGLETIYNFAEQAAFKSQLVSVLSPDLLAWPTHFDAEWGEEFRKLASEVANKNIAKLGDRCTEQPELILQLLHSRKQSVRAVIDFAKERGAGIIAAITHLADEQKTFLFPGSFIETLVAESTLPVLTVNSQAAAIKHFGKILVPTDFSTTCLLDFEKIVQFAKLIKCKIELVHALTVPDNITLMENASALGGWPRFETFIEDAEIEAKKKSMELLSIARNNNAEIEFKIIRGRSTLSQMILQEATKSQSNLIAMTSQTGSIVSLILGSIARQIMKDSLIPVLIFPRQMH